MGNLIAGAWGTNFFAGALHVAQGQLSRVSERRTDLAKVSCMLSQKRSRQSADLFNKYHSILKPTISSTGSLTIGENYDSQKMIVSTLKDPNNKNSIDAIEVYGMGKGADQTDEQQIAWKALNEKQQGQWQTLYDAAAKEQKDTADKKFQEVQAEYNNQMQKYESEVRILEEQCNSEKAILEARDRELEQEQKTLETMVKLLEGLQKAHEQLVASAAKDAAPKFGNQ